MADRLIEAEDEAELAWVFAQEALSRELDGASGERRAELARAMTDLKKGKVPKNPGRLAFADAAIREFTAAFDRADRAWADYYESFPEFIEKVSHEVRGVAAMEQFREAVIWQNRGAYHTGVKALARGLLEVKARGSKHRQHEELVANYWQRYCAKNDTVGFFGPVGWAVLNPEVNGIRIKYGPHLIKSRNVYFEVWCVDALAEALIRNERLRPFITLKRAPSIHLEGTALVVPFKAPILLSAAEAAVVELCEEARSAKELADQLKESAGFDDETDAYRLLEDLCGKSWLVPTSGVPSGAHPEQSLKKMIESIGEDGPREEALNLCAEIDAARRQVARAAGNAENLNRALGELEETFTRLTSVGATRSNGKMYAGRTLVYEDCRRDVDAEIGRQLIESLGPPLSLVLASARWLTVKAAGICRDAFERIYAGLAQKAGSRTVNALEFWLEAERFLNAGSPALTQRFESILQEAWSEVLAVPAGESRLNYSSENLRGQVSRTFDTASPGWPGARYHSPDILIAAASVEAIQRGEYQLILGELHAATNTLGWAFFVEQHPSPKDLFEAVDLDIPEPRIMPQVPKYWHGESGRCHNVLLSPKDFSLEFAITSPGLPNTRLLPIGSLVIEKSGQFLIARSRDDSLRLDIIDAFGEALAGKVIDSFKLLPDGAHRPRVTIDRLVVCRESWSFSPDEIDFAFEDNEANRFMEARRWARRHEMPRLVYFKSPVEIKPCFVDFESPIYVNIFAKTIRRTTGGRAGGPMITVTEMLPGPDELWLRDAEGNSYTSELRIVAVDLPGGA
jgi:hypothetical protein